MINKKGASSIFTYLTGTLVLALIAFIFLTSLGLGGGFTTAFNMGQFVAKIPVVVWVGLGIIILFRMMKK